MFEGLARGQCPALCLRLSCVPKLQRGSVGAACVHVCRCAADESGSCLYVLPSLYCWWLSVCWDRDVHEVVGHDVLLSISRCLSVGLCESACCAVEGRLPSGRHLSFVMLRVSYYRCCRCSTNVLVDMHRVVMSMTRCSRCPSAAYSGADGLLLFCPRNSAEGPNEDRFG